MLAQVGTFAVGLAFLCALYATGAIVWGLTRRDLRWTGSGRNATLAATGLLALASGLLLFAFLTDRFDVVYVYAHSRQAQPLALKVSALWAGQEGSLLVWSFVQALFATLVVVRGTGQTRTLSLWAGAFLSGITAFFVGLTLFSSNPFAVAQPPSADGLGMNPLLRHPGMIFHPPALYVGYVGLSVPFSFALAALVKGRFADWARVVRPWLLVAWVFLGAGLLLGMRWAYDVLGWGGYWGWDPVENAGLMPWLTATALVHGVLIQERDRSFLGWTLTLAVLSFGLVLFGTFATRSGLIHSVHAYAQSDIGGVLLAAIGVVLVGSTALLFVRRKTLWANGPEEKLISRQSAFYLTMLLLCTLTFSVFVGSILPTVTEWGGGQRLEVGPDWFDRVTGPQFAVLVGLLGVCPLLGRASNALRRLRGRAWALLMGPVLALGIAIALGFTRPLSWIGFGVVGLAGATVVVEIGLDLASAAGRGGDLSRWARPVRRVGAHLVHLGVILLAVGVLGTRLYGAEATETLVLGEEWSVGGQTLVIDELRQQPGDEVWTVEAVVSVYEGDRFRGQLTPGRRQYAGYQNPTSVPAVWNGLQQDVYLVLAGWTMGGSEITLTAITNPLVGFLWFGGLVLLAGGVLAMLPVAEKVSRKRTGVRWAWNWKALALGLLVLGVTGWAFWGTDTGAQRAGRGRPAVGAEAPPFSVDLLDGGTVALDELRGEVVLLNFWTPGCSSCREEAVELEALWQTYGDQGVNVLGVAYLEPGEGARQAAEDFGMSYPVGVDPTGAVGEAYGITGVPETFIIGPEGKVVAFHIGPVGRDVLEDDIVPLLEGGE